MHTRIQRTLDLIRPLDSAAAAGARSRQDSLTKPPGSLGRLEELAIQIAAIRGNARPRFKSKRIITFAADHGVVAEGVNRYPQEVTAQMVLNFARGGAAVNVLARAAGAQVSVVDIGVGTPYPHQPEIIRRPVGPGTRNMCIQPAMSPEEAEESVSIGIELADDLAAAGMDLVGVGEMGIGNSTAAAAMTAAFTGLPAAEVTDRGAGLTDQVLDRKIRVVERALALHRASLTTPIGILAAVGGFEIGGMAGAILGAASRRVPVVVDGFISTAAALVAVGLCPGVRPYLIASHLSVERGHRRALCLLGLKPLLDLDLRLGEGSGSATCFPLIDAATRILDEMATFAEAGVAEASQPG